MKDPDISLIICTRNRASDLQATLHALAQCQFANGTTAELIIVDNGSTDHTQVTVETAKLPQFTVRLLYEPRIGKGFAYNVGLRGARGSILALTDDDVRPTPTWLTTLTKPLISGAADVAAGAVSIAPHLLRPWMEPIHRVWFGSTENTTMPDFVAANVAFHRRVLIGVPSFDTRLGPGQLGYGDDTWFATKAAAHGFRFIFVPEAQVEHHFDASRLTRKSLLEMSRRFGRTGAYLAYHLVGRKTHWVWLRLFKAILKLLIWRCTHPLAFMRDEGIDPAEANRLSGVHYYLQWLKEQKTPCACLAAPATAGGGDARFVECGQVAGESRSTESGVRTRGQ